ncbi:MAG: hypothetical protein AAFP77_25865 [Bacteroidota bacterium]
MQNQSFHIIFAEGYYKHTLGFRSKDHASWNLPPLPAPSFRFGGAVANDLNLLIGVDGNFVVNDCDLTRVDFVINFEEFFNAQIQEKYLFYQHLANGEIRQLTQNIEIEYPYSNYPLKETQIRIAETPQSLLKQKWEGNCNKIGGEPIWVQQPEALLCPISGDPMQFIFQLDSGLPDLNERNANEIMFGNDGILYAFWSSAERVSGYLWQCT